ncbi:MAG: amidase [Pseudomonadota bacterium]
MMKNSVAGLAAALVLAACGGTGPADMTTPEVAAEPSLLVDSWPAKTLPELSDALAAGEVTSVELTQAYLDRIALVDPHLNAILALNAGAMTAAEASDARRSAGEALGPLDGLPILLKDNIETADEGLPTTAGALALRENVTDRDSPLVAGLRDSGAIILGKTNLSQWANFRSEDSISGWSALGGQVRNPHVLDRSPCGSSSGSGAAAAASLAAGTVGTETNGSVICPSNVNGVVGIKPTVGLVSQQHIVPISHSQDTAGPMTKTVRGGAMMLSAMATSDDTDFSAGLSADALSGQRIGVLRFAEGSNNDIKAAFAEALATLEAQGAELVDIDSFSPDVEGFWAKSRNVLDTEFKADLNIYLEGSPADLPVRSLDALIAYNLDHADIELPLFDQSIFDQANGTAGLDDPEYLEGLADVQRATGEMGIDVLLADNTVVAIVAPSGPVASHIDPVNGDVWPSWAGAGYLAAIAGYPNVTVPMGDVHGVPIGISFMASANQDATVIELAYAYEQASGKRIDPQFLPSDEERPEIKAAMSPLER